MISPYAFGAVNKEEQYIAINLTKKQIEESPPLDRTCRSRGNSRSLLRVLWMAGVLERPVHVGTVSLHCARPRKVGGNEPRRESVGSLFAQHSDVSGHAVQASDGEIGHVEDFIIDDETWAIRYLVIDTRNWWPGKKVLISPQWIERVSWSESIVFVNLPREAIKRSPEYTEASLPTRDYETGLHQHYNRQGYWVDEQAGKKHSPGDQPEHNHEHK